WRQIPREGKCERDRADGPRTPVAEREREDRNRRRGEPKPSDVLADRRGERERGRAGSEVDDVRPAKEPCARDSPRQADPEHAEDGRGEELLNREGEGTATREHSADHELERPDRRDREGRPQKQSPRIATSERDRGQEHHEEHEGERAGGKGKEREAREERAASELQEPE